MTPPAWGRFPGLPSSPSSTGPVATGRTRTIGDIVRAVADEHPDRVAVVDGSMRLSYRDLVDRADAAAVRLRELGLEPDDRILVQLPNGWEFIVLTLACFRSGVIPVMALPAHRRHELSHLGAVSQSRAIAVPRTLRDFDHEALALELVEAAAGPHAGAEPGP